MNLARWKEREREIIFLHRGKEDILNKEEKRKRGYLNKEKKRKRGYF